MLGSLVASCNLNDMPKFDNKDSFAAFPKSTMKIAENGGTLNVPVHVTSLGVGTTITYEFVDGTAKQGVDFDDDSDAATAGTLTFTADQSELTIPVKILPHIGTFTGDLSFTIKFKSTGDIQAGASNTCTVTITDTDHPLAFLLGSYDATAVSQWYGNMAWTVTLSKDEEDVTKIWMSDPCPYFASYNYSSKIYGIVNAEKTQIVFPNRQGHVSAYETAIVGFDTVDPYDATTDMDLIANITTDSEGNVTITFPNGYGTFNTGDTYDVVLDIDNEYYAIYDGGTKLVKK